MYGRTRLAMAAGLALAGCATAGQSPGSQQAGAAGSGQVLAAREGAPAERGCLVRSHLGMVRPGDNLPIGMQVRNLGTWCASGFGFSGVSAAGSRLVDPAAHGEVRLLPREGGIIFAYRPAPGYAGPDSFLITMPSGSGYDFNLAVTVDVAPAS